jgi:hypothetical protein
MGTVHMLHMEATKQAQQLGLDMVTLASYTSHVL